MHGAQHACGPVRKTASDCSSSSKVQKGTAAQVMQLPASANACIDEMQSCNSNQKGNDLHLEAE